MMQVTPLGTDRVKTPRQPSPRHAPPVSRLRTRESLDARARRIVRGRPNAPLPGFAPSGGTMAHGGDIIEELTSDHREAEEVFRQITVLPSGHRDRKRLIDHL